MMISRFARHALTSCLAAAILAGCGGSQPPIGAPGAMAQRPAVAAHAERSRSWMLLEAKNEDLLYVSNQTGHDVLILSLKGKRVGKIGGLTAGVPAGLCSDASGDVFVVVFSASNQTYIYEFAHGRTAPINTLNDDGAGIGCAVDPATGNLAVTNLSAPGSRWGNIAVYAKAEGSPTTYSDANVGGYQYCTYDTGGNLFADGYSQDLVDELPAGGTTLNEITLTQSIYPGSIQWVDSSLVVASAGQDYKGEQKIYQVQVSGDIGTVSNPVTLGSRHNTHARYLQFVAHGGTIIGPEWNNGSAILGFWRYPQGGGPIKTVHPGGEIFGVTVSVAPT